MENDENRIPDLATGARTGLFGSIGGRFISVLGNIIIARLLGPAIFGIYAIGWTLVRFFSLMIPLGMDRAVLRYAPRFWKKDSAGLKGLLENANKIAIGSGMLAGIIFFILAPWLANSVYMQPELTAVFRLFSFAYPMISLLVVAAAATRITRQIQYSVWLYDIGQPLLGLGLIITFFLLGLGINWIVLAEVISLGCAALAAILVLNKVFPEIKGFQPTREMKPGELLAYSVPAMLGGAFSVYILWLDRIFVGLFLSTYDNGIYTAISQISTIFLVISAGISPIVVPLFAHYHHTGDKAKLEEVYRISTKWGIYISIPIMAVLLVSPAGSLTLIFGPEYSSGTIPLLILLGGQIINLLTGSVNPLLIMTDNQKILLRISLVSIILEIILLVTLIPLWGLIGAAVSTSVCLSLLYLYELFWVRSHLDFWPYDKRYLKGIISTCFCFISVVIVHLLTHFSPILKIVTEALVSIVTFIGTLVILKLDSEDLEFLHGLLSSSRKTLHKIEPPSSLPSER